MTCDELADLRIRLICAEDTAAQNDLLVLSLRAAIKIIVDRVNAGL